MGAPMATKSLTQRGDERRSRVSNVKHPDGEPINLSIYKS